ncbi:hypothetical protein C8R44DRAFT_881477 [Mycena epipterygia]|nr:hypothetical protein C8R44DRAFT_881477 [Mycena epipterygia]
MSSSVSVRLWFSLPGVCGAHTTYRSLDCGPTWPSCLIGAHGRQPTHQIVDWQNEYIERETLTQLGLRVRLGHGLTALCFYACPRALKIISIGGVSDVNVDLCGCDEYRQAIVSAHVGPDRALAHLDHAGCVSAVPELLSFVILI